MKQVSIFGSLGPGNHVFAFWDNLRPSWLLLEFSSSYFVMGKSWRVWIDIQQVFRTPKLWTLSSDKWTLNIKHRIGNESIAPSAILARIKPSLQCGDRVLRCAFSQLVQANTALRSRQWLAKKVKFTVGLAAKEDLPWQMKQERLTETYLLHVTQTSVRYVCESVLLCFCFFTSRQYTEPFRLASVC